jgi:hypothetical protein
MSFHYVRKEIENCLALAYEDHKNGLGEIEVGVKLQLLVEDLMSPEKFTTLSEKERVNGVDYFISMFDENKIPTSASRGLLIQMSHIESYIGIKPSLYANFKSRVYNLCSKEWNDEERLERFKKRIESKS